MSETPIPVIAIVAPVLRPTPHDHPEAVILLADDGKTPLRMVLAHHGYRAGQRVKIEPLPPDEWEQRVPAVNPDPARPDWGRALPCPEDETIAARETLAVGKSRA